MTNIETGLTLPDQEKLKLAREKYQKEFGPGETPGSKRAIAYYLSFIKAKMKELGKTPNDLLLRQRTYFWMTDPDHQYVGIEPYQFWQGLAVIAFASGVEAAGKFLRVGERGVDYRPQITHGEVCELMGYFIGEQAIPICNLTRQAEAARKIILETLV